ncbi:hypothetical protein, partial [Actinomadura sp. LOL_011]|uniref:hypothetical protein n=1 Tax=Actinomadura sp. LOL_011 TaxID=3345410 RepID=UPI003A80B535
PPVTTSRPQRRPITTVKTWYGQATRSFWALVPWPSGEHGALLVEAATEPALTSQINRIREQLR